MPVYTYTTFRMGWLMNLLRRSPLLQPIIGGRPISRLVFKNRDGSEFKVDVDDVEVVEVQFL